MNRRREKRLRVGQSASRSRVHGRQFVEIIAEHRRRLIYGESYRFDVMGRWQSAAGLANGPIGRQVAASTYGLHFGNYGGLAVEVAYVLFGFALCAITATGMTLWLEKRRRRGLQSDRQVAYWRIVVWDTPIILVVAAWLDRIAGDKLPTTIVYWSMLACGSVSRPFR